jgi:putative glycosyltransferase
MKLSIVTPLYESSAYIQDLWTALSENARAVVGDNFEIIMVNDGSRDDGLSVARRIADSEPNLSVIDLSRNFGQHAAILAGIERATGDRVFIIDADLEEDACWIQEFSQLMDDTDCDVVFGVQQTRRGKGPNRWAGSGFYKAYQWLVGHSFVPNQTTARLMNARYTKAILMYPERDVFLGGIMADAGFIQIPHLVDKKRVRPSTYTIASQASQAMTGLLSFSSRPLVVLFAVGILVSAVSAVMAGSLIYQWLGGSTSPSGWRSMIVALLLSTGVLLVAVSLVGLYVAKVFTEVKHRPRSIVRSVYGAPKPK